MSSTTRAPHGYNWDAFSHVGKWERISKRKLLLRSVVIAPIRFGVFLLAILFIVVLVVVVPQRWAHDVLLGLTKLICTVVGLRIDSVGRPVIGRAAPLIVCNHVGMIDVIVLLSLERISFLSDNAIRRFFIIGKAWGFVADRIGCLFVSRDDASSRTSARAALAARASEIVSGSIPNRLALFPDGTTSNGPGILPFKLGAFEQGVPVQPVVLDYSRKEWGYCSVWSDV